MRGYHQRRIAGARLALQERREAVRQLTAPAEEGGEGLSAREVAQVLGVSKSTVADDERAVQNRTADTDPAPGRDPAPVQNRTTPPPRSHKEDHARRREEAARAALTAQPTQEAAAALVARVFGVPGGALWDTIVRADCKDFLAAMKATGTSNIIWISPPESDATWVAACGMFTCHSSSR